MPRKKRLLYGGPERPPETFCTRETVQTLCSGLVSLTMELRRLISVLEEKLVYPIYRAGLPISAGSKVQSNGTWVNRMVSPADASIPPKPKKLLDGNRPRA